MFSLKVLNRLRLAGDVAAEVISSLPDHKAWVLIRPQVDPEKAIRDKISRRWMPVYVDGDIIARFDVNYVEIETQQIETFFSGIDIDVRPTINMQYSVASEDELASLASRWVDDLSTFRDPHHLELAFNFVY